MKSKLKALLCLTSITLSIASAQSVATFASDGEGEYSIGGISLYSSEDASEICRAVEYQDFGRLQEIVNENPGSVNVYNYRHLTPLHIAVASGCSEIAKFLIGKNADLNLTDELGRTPLHYAVFNDDIELVKAIVESGRADINVKNLRGFTPYHEAITSENDYIIQILGEYGGAY